MYVVSKTFICLQFDLIEDNIKEHAHIFKLRLQ